MESIKKKIARNTQRAIRMQRNAQKAQAYKSLRTKSIINAVQGEIAKASIA